MPLSEYQIRAAKPREKPYKLMDGQGLVLLIAPTGARLWRLRYRFAGREGMISVGSYPATSLKEARERRDTARKQIEAGLNPSSIRAKARERREVTFEAIAKEWLARQAFTAKTRTKAEWMIHDLLVPYIGSRPINELTAPEILAVLRRIEARGRLETCHRAKWRIGQIIRYAVATGRALRDPTGDLRGALKPPKTVNRSAITAPRRFGDLLLAIDGYQGQGGTWAALRLAPLLFARPGELRAAEWQEFTLEGETPEWRIPAERMKMKEEHIVPLSRQAIGILKELQTFTGRGRFLFPSLRTSQRPISDNTLNAALRRLGFSKDEMSTHGFRATASTMLNESGVAPDLIELQLAHAERNKVRAAYNRAQRLAERRQMMQRWADYLDELRVMASSSNVVPLRRYAS
ncbi:MAG TPA: integrase arm-type DNA-binding domain-containing protein [Steroidobacteraceae bacterium]|nr:integrase arm-type DNA-binding domain-containing protein [Steroidobacteraceae bacterium]